MIIVLQPQHKETNRNKLQHTATHYHNSRLAHLLGERVANIWLTLVCIVCCSVLQCVAVCCQGSPGYCGVSRSFVWQGLNKQITRVLVYKVCCSVLQCVAVRCSVLQCVADTLLCTQCITVCLQYLSECCSVSCSLVGQELSKPIRHTTLLCTQCIAVCVWYFPVCCSLSRSLVV